MAGLSSDKPDQPITGINVTPLVDIVLVLLIIFMVTAKLVVSRAVPLDLPQAATDGEVQQLFSVTVDRSGMTMVDGEPIGGDADLLQRAKRAYEAHPKLRAVIQAEGEVPHRKVMAVLDVLRQAGLTQVAFGVQHVEPLEGAVSP